VVRGIKMKSEFAPIREWVEVKFPDCHKMAEFLDFAKKEKEYAEFRKEPAAIRLLNFFADWTTNTVIISMKSGLTGEDLEIAQLGLQSWAKTARKMAEGV